MTTEETSNAGTPILLLNRDLMAGVAIGNAAKALGFRIERAPNEQVLVERLTANPDGYALAILDMNLEIDFEQIAALIEGNPEIPPVIGFGPHVDIEGRRSAKSARLTRIYANSEFHRDMGKIIDRYTRKSAEQVEHQDNK